MTDRWTRLCVGAGVLMAALLVGHGLAYAAYGVAIEVGAPRSAQPGELVTHVFTVENVGQEPDQYTLELTPPAGWTPLPVAEQISLAPGERTRLFVTLMIPPGAQAGAYTIELRATSVGDPTEEAVAEGIVDLLPVVEVVMEAIRVDRASPGTEAQHLLRIRNAGNVPDTYRIEVRATPAWTVRVAPTELPVLPGAQRDVTVTVLIPPTAAPGTAYRVRVEATSQTDPTLTRTLWIPAIVAPPPPDEVPVSLFPEIPLTFRLGLTEQGDPSFRLSIAGEVPTVGRVTGSRVLDMLGLTSQAAGFHTADWGVEWGTVSVSGAFASVSGAGLGVHGYEADRRTTQLVLTDAGQGLAGSLSWALGTLRALVTNVEGPPARRITEVQLMGTFGENFSLSAVLAQGWTERPLAEAFRIRPSMRVGEVAGFVELAEVSPDFPGQAAREQSSWGLSLGTGLAPLRGAFSTTTTVTLTQAGPPEIRTTTGGFTASASVRPSVRTIGSFSLRLETRESDDLPKTTDEGTRRLGVTFTDRGPTVTWSLSGTHRTAWNDVADTKVATTGMRITARAPLGQLTTRGTLSIEQTTDLAGGDRSRFASSLTLRCSLPQVALAPSVGLSISGGRSVLSASVSWTDVGGWSLSASVDAPLAPEGGFSFTTTFTLPTTFRLLGPTYGAIRGRAFVDVDGTGRYDPGDPPVSDLLLEADDQQAVTGRDGRFAFFPFLPGAYEVSIADLPFGLHPLVELPLTVHLRAGREVELLIPMESRSLIRGTVFHDLDQDGRRDPGEPGVPGVQLLVASADVREHVRTDAAGRFAVEVPAGRYNVELLPESLPPRFELTTPTEVQVEVEERAFTTVDFGAWQRPRPIVVEPVAPIARFAVQPAMPRVGEEVTFDAADSQAMGDARIVAYSWEFRMGPRLIQARGEEVTVVFDEPGAWVVTLRVTDSAGQTAQAQRIVTVR